MPLVLGMANVLPISIPRDDSDWKPKLSINAAYYHFLHDKNEFGNEQDGIPFQNQKSPHFEHIDHDTIHQARFLINSTIPAVNLDNFPLISTIQCLDDDATVILNFTDHSSALFAYQEWFLDSKSNNQNMTFFLNQHHGCFGKSHIQALHINSMSLEKNSLIVDTQSLNHSIVFGNYEVYMGKIPASSLQPRYSKRDTHTTKKYELNVNYLNGSVYNSNFTLVNFTKNVILQFPRISAYCIDCFTRGNASFDMYVKTANSKIVDYKIRTRGEIHSSAGFDFNFPKSADKRLVSFGAFYANLGPSIYIPGLFYFGLSAAFGGSFTYAANQKFKMQFGFETNEAFDIVIEPNRDSKNFSISRIFELPKITKLDTNLPVSKHHPFTITNTTDIIYSLHFSPMIDFTLAALEVDVGSFKLSFDTAIGLQSMTGKARFCTNVEREFEMQRRHAFNFDVKLFGWSYSLWRFGFSWAGFALARKHVEIWATKYLKMECDFCASESKCPPGYLNLNRTVPKQGGLDNFS
jgi:hypothetical protein